VPLLLSTLVVVAIGFAPPFSPLADTLRFGGLPAGLVVVIAAIIPAYLLLVELAKRRFYRREATRPTPEGPRRSHRRRIARRAARWSVPSIPRRRIHRSAQQWHQWACAASCLIVVRSHSVIAHYSSGMVRP
jgi:Mg2+-importing ATPase